MKYFDLTTRPQDFPKYFTLLFVVCMCNEGLQIFGRLSRGKGPSSYSVILDLDDNCPPLLG
jgi:hypothetical protein